MANEDSSTYIVVKYCPNRDLNGSAPWIGRSLHKGCGEFIGVRQSVPSERFLLFVSVCPEKTRTSEFLCSNLRKKSPSLHGGRR